MIGDAQTAQTAQQVTTAAGAGVSAAAIAAGVSWAPVVGPIVAGVALAIGFLLNRKSAQQKTAATQIVDELEKHLKTNVDGYFESPRTAAAQAAALANFDQAWNWLTSAEGCGNRDLSDAGRRCISERQAGGRWDWFARYRDPIAQDVTRADVFGAPLPAGMEAKDLLIPAGLILAGVLL